MKTSQVLAGVVLAAAIGLAAAILPARLAGAGSQPGAPATGGAQKCKALEGKPCCDPALAAHLPLSAVFAACGESEATYRGEDGSDGQCRYYFNIEGQKQDATYVSIFSPPVPDPPTKPSETFFTYTKVGNVYVTDKPQSPDDEVAVKSLKKSTGLWMPGKGYFVTVSASTAVCDRSQAIQLAPAIK
jgi:hypothetical protein